MRSWRNGTRKIALLKARADKAKTEAKIEYYKTIDTLEHKKRRPGQSFMS